MNSNQYAKEIKVDPELKRLIPPLSSEEYEQLKANILEAGECHDPLLIWNGTIIDGHNRWRIIQENPQIAYQVKEMDFSSRSDAMAWMIRNQLGRRNLTAFARTELSLKLKPLLAEEAKKRQGERNDLKDIPQKSAGSEVRDEIAKSAKVSHDTVSRVEKLIEKAPEEVKEQLRRGEVSINKAYNKIREPKRPSQPKDNIAVSTFDPAQDRLKKWMDNKLDFAIGLVREQLITEKSFATDEIVENVIETAKNKLDALLNDYYNQTL